MVRTKRSAKLDTRNARVRLAIAQNHMEPISKGKYLVYRKPRSGAAGSWSACFVNQDTKKQTRTHIGTADDLEDANGNSALSFSQAQTKALDWFKTKERQATLEADGEILPEGVFTVAQAIDAYCKDRLQLGKRVGVDARWKARIWILPYFGNLPVAKLTRIRIENWLNEIANAPRRTRTKKGNEPTQASPPVTKDEKRARKCTANGILFLLKAALTMAVDKRLVDAPERPWQLVKSYKGVTKSRQRFLSPEEQVKFVQACTGEFKHLVRGALLTGCRYSELTRLRAKDYDPKNETIFIAEAKSGKPRHIYLSKEGTTFFGKLIAKSNPKDLIFTHPAKRIKRTQGETNAWMEGDTIRFMKEACIAADIEPFTFHELRHTYASTLVNKGVPLVYVAAQLGHTTTIMVERHYGHIAPNAMAQSIRSAMPTLGILKTKKDK